MTAEWYYIGHYGQLGPLTLEQMVDLVEGGVISRETYVWRHGMTDWRLAGQIPDLDASLRSMDPFLAPPPPPMPTAPPPMPSLGPSAVAPSPVRHPESDAYLPYGTSQMSYAPVYGIRSDKSRITAGLLNIFLPGVGRMYLGYFAYGLVQLILTFCSGGILWVWSIIDGVLMLAGNVRHDGYGRLLRD